MPGNRGYDQYAQTLVRSAADSMQRVAEVGDLSLTFASMVLPQLLQVQKRILTDPRRRREFAKDALGAWVELFRAQREQREHLREVEARLFEGFTNLARSLTEERPGRRAAGKKRRARKAAKRTR
jgi:hypothetical protein